MVGVCAECAGAGELKSCRLLRLGTHAMQPWPLGAAGLHHLQERQYGSTMP